MKKWQKQLTKLIENGQPGCTVVFDPKVRELEEDPRFETMEIRATFVAAGKIVTDGERANIDTFVESLFGKTLLVSDIENGNNIGFIEIMQFKFQPKKAKPIH